MCIRDRAVAAIQARSVAAAAAVAAVRDRPVAPPAAVAAIQERSVAPAAAVAAIQERPVAPAAVAAIQERPVAPAAPVAAIWKRPVAPGAAVTASGCVAGPVAEARDVAEAAAAAVAAGLCSAATGTDTGGSIRQPSAHCGITGLKPTYGRISRWGMIAFASSLDQAGPMARTAEDAALLLQVMSGSDSLDSTSLDEPVPDYRANLKRSLEGLRIGLCEDFFATGLEADSEQVIQEAITVFEQLGAKISRVALPHIAQSIPAYYVIAPAEASANLSRFDGIRFGYRCENPSNLEDLYSRSRSEGFGEEVKRRIMIGAFTLSTGYYDAYYRKAQQIRRLIKIDFQIEL